MWADTLSAKHHSKTNGYKAKSRYYRQFLQTVGPSY
jgi:hypothetical protein